MSVAWHRRDLAGLSGAPIRVGVRYYVVTDVHKSWVRQRFTAAHELKHYLTERHLAPVFTCSRRLDTAIERTANVFTRELLMPEETMRFLYEKGLYAPEQIGRVLGVSAQAAGLRMAELELGREQVWSWSAIARGDEMPVELQVGLAVFATLSILTAGGYVLEGLCLQRVLCRMLQAAPVIGELGWAK